ncbi:MAG TPA: SIMPL domain-containing protein [Caulobacteraceae bacterium]|nr:SIMPL domain-containing protein [Caulobacteraceae bacterium]
MLRSAALLLCLLGLSACGSGEPDPRGVKPDEVLLQVRASARGEARPDEARFTVGVNAVRPTAREAGAETNRILGRISAALAELGVKPEQMQTRNISLARIDYGPERGRYRAENLIEVRLSQPARAGEAIAAATEAGGNVLSGPDLRVRDPEAAYNAAYAAAYRAARARAEAYAGAAGLKVRRVLAIRDGSVHEAPIGYERAYGASVDAAVQSVAPVNAGPPVSPGLNVREVSVRADFALGR